jgi:protein TonB
MSPGDMAEEDLIDITRNEPEKKEPPSPAMPELIIVSNDAPDLDDPIFFDPTIDINQGIQIQKWTDMPDEVTDNTDQVFVRVEDMPRFNGGGIEKFWEYVLAHVRYPEEARDAGLQGRIQVGFVVNEKGQIINIQLLRKIHPMLDNEVIKVLEEAPLWTPGRQRNRPVKVGFSIPVVFKLSQ